MVPIWAKAVGSKVRVDVRVVVRVAAVNPAVVTVGGRHIVATVLVRVVTKKQENYALTAENVYGALGC